MTLNASEQVAISGAACSGKPSCLGPGGDTENTPTQFIQQELPSFFDLVSENCSGHLDNLIRYAQICHILSTARDYEGYIRAADKLLDQAREFAKYLKLLKNPSILSNETADSLEEEALRLKERAGLLEIEAAQIRAS